MKDQRASDYFNNNNIDYENALFLPDSHKILTYENLSYTIPKIDLKNSQIPKFNDIANLNKNYNSKSLNSLEKQISGSNILISTRNPEEADRILLDNLEVLLYELKRKKSAFKDKSRLFCCGCFSVCMVMVIIVFYIFDVMKYQETCNKTKKNYIELCDAPSIGFWPRFIFLSLSIIILIFSIYCTGPTIITFDPFTNKIYIDKKKIFCLPSVHDYKMDDLLYAYIESDTTDGTPNLSNFSFYSVILVFKQDQINLGLGRDCFLINEKIQLVHKINRYLDAYRTKVSDYYTYNNTKTF